jgi:hypothetical protein
VPNLRIPAVAVPDVSAAVKEGAYVAVGFGVLGLQRAQVRRHQLAKQLNSQVASATVQLSGVTAQASEAGHAVSRQVLAARARLGSLPLDQAVAPARQQLAGWTKQVDSRLAPARHHLDQRLDRLEERLPIGARTMVRSVRAAAKAPEARIRSAAGLDDSPPSA